MKTQIKLFLRKPKMVSFINALLIIFAITLNISLQSFCIPSLWAAIVIAICSLNMILSPIVYQNHISNIIVGFLSGISFFVFLYCIIFLEHLNIIGIGLLFIGVGFATYVPHVFLIQLLWRNLIKPNSIQTKKSFLLASSFCVISIMLVGYQYKSALTSIESFKESNYQELKKTFMTEKILGMHFIYHTRICEYDGWRPPKHEPLLIIGMWLNGRKDPLDLSLKERLILYKKFFPNKPFKFSCSCAIEGSYEYQNDALWK